MGADFVEIKMTPMPQKQSTGQKYAISRIFRIENSNNTDTQSGLIGIDFISNPNNLKDVSFLIFEFLSLTIITKNLSLVNSEYYNIIKAEKNEIYCNCMENCLMQNQLLTILTKIPMRMQNS